MPEQDANVIIEDSNISQVNVNPAVSTFSYWAGDFISIFLIAVWCRAAIP
jgi:hypothetical protein